MTAIPPPPPHTQSQSLQPKPPAKRIRTWSITWSFSLYMIAVVVIALTLTALIVNRLLSDSLALDQQSLLTERVAQQVEQVRDFRDTQLLVLRRVATDKQFPISAAPEDTKSLPPHLGKCMCSILPRCPGSKRPAPILPVSLISRNCLKTACFQEIAHN
jgi:hypothetical protein